MTRLVLRRLEVVVTRSVQAFFADGCTHRAAAISYYVLFSLFPLVIFTAGIVGLFLRDPELQARVVDAIMETIPLSQDPGPVPPEAVQPTAPFWPGENHCTYLRLYIYII
jgi:uncharacterized BrkB/YihY/UPF0761 family membrane protein